MDTFRAAQSPGCTRDIVLRQGFSERGDQRRSRCTVTRTPHSLTGAGSMKSLVRRCAVTAMLGSALLGIPLQSAAAPVKDTRKPAAPAVDNSFPRLLPLTFEVTPSDDRELKSFRELTVTVQEVEDEYATTLIGPV